MDPDPEKKQGKEITLIGAVDRASDCEFIVSWTWKGNYYSNQIKYLKIFLSHSSFLKIK